MDVIGHSTCCNSGEKSLGTSITFCATKFMKLEIPAFITYIGQMYKFARNANLNHSYFRLDPDLDEPLVSQQIITGMLF